MNGPITIQNWKDIKVIPPLSSNWQSKSNFDLEAIHALQMQMFSITGLPPAYIQAMERERDFEYRRLRLKQDDLSTFKNEYMGSWAYGREDEKGFSKAARISNFWNDYYLYKHDSDEVDEDGPIQVYSIVDKYSWNLGVRTIEQSPEVYEVWARHLPKGLFEEVAANWYELTSCEEDLQGEFKITIVTDKSP